jgi:hypothetical protein
MGRVSGRVIMLRGAAALAALAAVAGCARMREPAAFLSMPMDESSVFAPMDSAATAAAEPAYEDVVAAGSPRMAAALSMDDLAVLPMRHQALVAGAYLYIPVDKKFSAGPGGALRYAWRPHENFEANIEGGFITLKGNIDRGGDGTIDMIPVTIGCRYMQEFPEAATIFVGLGAGYVHIIDKNVAVVVNPLLPNIFVPITLSDAFGAYIEGGIGYPFLLSRAVVELEYRWMFAASDVKELGASAELTGHELRVNVGFSF